MPNPRGPAQGRPIIFGAPMVLANPEVVALSFTVHRCNIDDMPAQGRERNR